MKMCRVVNMYNEMYDVNIQRGTLWGNPYRVEDYGREKAIQLYKEHLHRLVKERKITKAHLEVLRGMRLGCTCVPRHKCHGEILAELVNRVFGDTPLDIIEVMND